MAITFRPLEEAAGASAITGQVSMVAGLCCGNVQGVPITSLHGNPDDMDGGIVTLRESCDAGEGAGGWGERTYFLKLTF